MIEEVNQWKLTMFQYNTSFNTIQSLSKRSLQDIILSGQIISYILLFLASMSTYKYLEHNLHIITTLLVVTKHQHQGSLLQSP